MTLRADDPLNKLTAAIPGVVYQFLVLPDGRWSFLYLSPGVKTLFEVSPEAACADHNVLTQCIVPEDRAAHREAIEHSFMTLTPWVHEYRICPASGTHRWVRGQAVPERQPDGSVLWNGILVDISDQKHAEEALRKSEELYRAVTDNGRALIWLSGLDKGCYYFNRPWLEFTGRTLEQESGSGWISCVHPDDFQRCMNTYVTAFDRREKFSMVYRLRRHDGEYRSILDEGTPRYDDGGNFVGYVGHCLDITERQQAEEEIHRLAYFDALTQLPNRRLLQDRLGQALAGTARSGLFGAILFIDLDNFKALNDTRGHDVGDLLLVEVAKRLRAVVREADTVARQGGDEFVMLLEDLSAEVNEAAGIARQLGEKLREAIGQPFFLKGYEYRCRLSIGVSLFHENDTVEDLLKHADLALYQAKNAGRNTLRFFDPAMQEALDRRCALESELQLALEQGQFELYYQPQLDAARHVTGAEALLRWQHPQRGLVPPMDFIALAEETSLILPIGLWVLTRVCAQLRAWESNPRTSKLQIAVNVSARQFRQDDFVAQVQKVLEESGANPAGLKLELKDRLMLEDVDGAIAKVEAIKRLGVACSIDDFGTGDSFLSYLARLPLDQLKIGQSFVRNLPGKRNDETITRTIIAMGQGLAMDVLAEGVETEAQREFLKLHGCRSYQGYLFSRPLPLEAFEAFVIHQ